MTFVLATRRSQLALWQAETAARLLRAAWSGLDVELLPVESAGDRDQKAALERFGRIGIFTVEVDRAVIEGRADAAVHSLKDMTTTLLEGVQLAGVLARGPVEDAWLSPAGTRLADLPPGSRVATGSLRRRAMLLARRPDLVTVGIRGNIDTRLAKLAAGAADGMILARAGLARLGLAERITEVLDTRTFLPAVGQGLVGLTCRAGDEAAARRLFAITDLEARDAGVAERALLAGLRGGCNVPVGAHARVVESTLSLRARVLSPDGTQAVEGEITGARDQAAPLGDSLARDLLERGAGRLIEEARG
ncbi:MAG: hydroxymethylbilane synthase [Planctomycetota bacterium]